MVAATNLRKPVRVLIVDDHRLFAEALEAILSGDRRIEIAGQQPPARRRSTSLGRRGRTSS